MGKVSGLPVFFAALTCGFAICIAGGTHGNSSSGTARARVEGRSAFQAGPHGRGFLKRLFGRGWSNPSLVFSRPIPEIIVEPARPAFFVAAAMASPPLIISPPMMMMPPATLPIVLGRLTANPGPDEFVETSVGMIQIFPDEKQLEGPVAPGQVLAKFQTSGPLAGGYRIIRYNGDGSWSPYAFIRPGSSQFEVGEPRF